MNVTPRTWRSGQSFISTVGCLEFGFIFPDASCNSQLTRGTVRRPEQSGKQPTSETKVVKQLAAIVWRDAGWMHLFAPRSGVAPHCGIRDMRSEFCFEARLCYGLITVSCLFHVLLIFYGCGQYSESQLHENRVSKSPTSPKPKSCKLISTFFMYSKCSFSLKMARNHNNKLKCL